MNLVAEYREFEPSPAVRPYVRRLFSFAPPENKPRNRIAVVDVGFRCGDSFCSPTFADAGTSIVIRFDRCCKDRYGWFLSRPEGAAHVVGPATKAAPAAPEAQHEMVGAYLNAGCAAFFRNVPVCELADRVIELHQIVGTLGRDLTERLSNASGQAERIDLLESALLGIMGAQQVRRTAIDTAGLTGWVRARNGNVTVEQLATAAGVSRQQLTRVFRNSIGLSPKLYCRLARFQAVLAILARDGGTGFADTAIGAGYADQSHMIAEFREFSGLTPRSLASGAWFHPFIERLRIRSA